MRLLLRIRRYGFEPLRTRQVKALLRRWGFSALNGSHGTYQPPNRARVIDSTADSPADPATTVGPAEH
jgi:hypothetical protein